MPSNQTLYEYCYEWYQTFKRGSVKDSTLRKYLASLSALKADPLGSIPYKNVTSKDVQQYINRQIQHGYGAGTISCHIIVIREPLASALDEEEIEKNPVDRCKLPSPSRCKCKPRKVDAYTKEEQEALWQVIDKRINLACDVVGFMLEEGVRSAEACALQWKDVNWEAKTVQIRRIITQNEKMGFHVEEGGKTRSGVRTIPLTDKAIQILRRCQTEFSPQDEFCFLNNQGGFFSHDTLDGQVRTICRKANVRCTGSHIFRHTFATNLYHKGVEIKVLSKILGHSNVAITYDIYVHLYGDGIEDMRNAMM